MKNGLYSLHMHMLDGVKGRDSGVLILRDGLLLGGGPHFWSTGSYSVGQATSKGGTWKGQLSTDQHTHFTDPFVRPLFGGIAVDSGLFRDIYRRHRGGVRNGFDRTPQPELPCHAETTCRRLRGGACG